MTRAVIFKVLFGSAFLISLILFLVPNVNSGVSIPHIDKLVHIIIFLGLAFLFDYSYGIAQDKKISLLISYGLIVEIIQTTVGREASVGDAIADLTGTLIYFYWLKIYICQFKIVKYLSGKSE